MGNWWLMLLLRYISKHWQERGKRMKLNVRWQHYFIALFTNLTRDYRNKKISKIPRLDLEASGCKNLVNSSKPIRCENLHYIIAAAITVIVNHQMCKKRYVCKSRRLGMLTPHIVSNSAIDWNHRKIWSLQNLLDVFYL